nr:MAG TPA: Putative amidoligase enzyme [Caudoviricetes sp.]
MMHREKKIEDRKVLVRRLEELLGTKAVYLGMPSAAYKIGDYIVTRTGALEVEEEKAGDEILNTLCKENLLLGDPEEETKTEEREEEKPFSVTITLPMEGHTGQTLRNLVNLLSQRADLINKATGAFFSAGEELTEALQKEEKDIPRERFLEILDEHKDALTGLVFTNEEIRFTGFADTDAKESLCAEMQLASFMNKQALSQKRIQPKAVRKENEKYFFRIWLIRMGMKGNAYKETRKLLLQNLSGNCAFCTEEEARAFREKQKAKRNEAKEAGQDEVSEQTND